jgi:hypothetical protein
MISVSFCNLADWTKIGVFYIQRNLRGNVLVYVVLSDNSMFD